METTSTTAVPAWIDLDVIAPSDVREEAARLVTALRDVQTTLAAIAADARLLLTVAEQAEKSAMRSIEDTPLSRQYEVGDGVMNLIAHLTGARELYDVMQSTSDIIHPEIVLKGDQAIQATEQ